MLARSTRRTAVDKQIARLALALALALAASGCARPPAVPVTVLFDGEAAQVAALRRALVPGAVEGLVLRQGAIAPRSDLAEQLGAAEVAAAYEDFVAGDGSRCRERLAAVDVPRLLAYRQRTAAARALLLDARCAEGLGSPAAADARFAEFAAYELDLAETTGVLSPALRPRLDRALAAAGRAPRVRLDVSGAVGGRVLIDGRLAGCAAPCSPVVSAGGHVVSIEADGVALAWRKLMIEPPAAGAAAPAAQLPRLAASAAEAAQQWHVRAGSGFAPDDATGLSLLRVMAGDERLIYLRVAASAEAAAEAAKPAAKSAPRSDSPRSAAPLALALAGALVVQRREPDAPIISRGRRLSLEAAPALVRQLAIDAEVIEAPRPRWFWPVLVGSVIATAAVTAAILYQPETRTVVEF